MTTKTLIKRLFTYLNKQVGIMILSLSLIVCSVVLSIYIPILFGKSIDLIKGINDVDKRLYDNLMIIVILILVNSVISFIYSILNNKIAFLLERNLRNDLYSHIQRVPIKYIDKTFSGDIISATINDVQNVTEGLLLGFTSLVSGLLTIILTLFIMFIINYFLAIIVLIITPLSLIVSKKLSGKSYSLFNKVVKSKALVTSVIDETMSSLKVVKAYNHEDKSYQMFLESSKILEEESVKAVFISSLTNPLTRAVNAFVYAIVALVGALCIVKPIGGITLSIGMLSTMLTYANQYTKPFNEISGVLTEVQSALASLRRVFKMLDVKEEEVLPYELKNVSGNISFKDVSFSYDKEVPLIKNFSFFVNNDDVVAIVGKTGCGKTTLINLLMRFYDVDKGGIYFDDKLSLDVSVLSIRSLFGMVLQETWIKEGSVFENIAYGKKNASLDEVIQAAKNAYCHDFIMKLPHGYNTVISDDGRLSEGEKQLICIARVMLSNKPFLILDEATSNIDILTEANIQKAFRKLMKGKTTFIVAHHLETIKNASCIIVMDKGDIVESGTHDELIKKKGVYASLYNNY